MEIYNKPSQLSLVGNLAENWRRFKQQFEIFLTATNKNDDDADVKVAMLLNFAGEEAIELFNTFTFTAVKDSKDLTIVIETFRVYCNRRFFFVYERYIFWKTVQIDETIDMFITQLKQKIRACEYPGNIQDDMVRDKMVQYHPS